MGRPPRITVGGLVYHALNRASGGAHIFNKPGDREAFEKVLGEAKQQVLMRVLAYCVMPTHWHLVLWPWGDGDLPRFVQWLTKNHVERWRSFRRAPGLGHLYQGRFKSFPVQTDRHFLAVCRYVERNPVAAGLVERAEDWRWSSLWRRLNEAPADDGLLSAWPVPVPPDWVSIVNGPEDGAERKALSECARSGRGCARPGAAGSIAQRTSSHRG